MKSANQQIEYLAETNKEKDTHIEKMSRKYAQLKTSAQMLQSKLMQAATPGNPNDANESPISPREFSPHLPTIMSSTARDGMTGPTSPTGANGAAGPSASVMTSMMKTSNGNFLQEKKKHEAQAERLIHSVNAVTDLLRANTELRDNLEK